MARTETLLEVAKMLRKAASMLEAEARGVDASDRQPRTPGLKKMIRSLMEDGHLRSSREVVDALYSPEMGVDRGTFARRVSVTLSLLNKSEGYLELFHSTEGPRWREKTKPA